MCYLSSNICTFIVNVLEKGELSERMMVNHFVVDFTVFDLANCAVCRTVILGVVVTADKLNLLCYKGPIRKILYFVIGLLSYFCSTTNLIAYCEVIEPFVWKSA